MNRKLLVIKLIIAFFGLLKAQIIDVTIVTGINSTNHSVPEITDWIDCGGDESNMVENRKTGVQPLIWLETIGTETPGWLAGTSEDILRSWTDGFPTAEASDENGKWIVWGLGNGFQFTVPAGLNMSRLTLSLGAHYSNSMLIVTTSDGAFFSSGDLYSDGGVSGDDGVGRLFIIQYQAASANQTLIVTWTCTKEFAGGLNGGATGVAYAELIVTSTVEVDEESTVISEEFQLSQNYPNPFNPFTNIYYTLTNESDVAITVYDMLGQEINQLISQKQLSGNHSVQWNGTDHNGNTMGAGIYLYQLKTREFIQTKKMVLMK